MAETSPSPAADNDGRHRLPTYPVPVAYRAELALLFARRRELHQFSNPKANGSRFQRTMDNEAAISRVVESMRIDVRLPEDAIIEFESEELYTVTSLQAEWSRYHEWLAARKPEETSRGGPTLEYMLSQPPEHAHWSYLFSDHSTFPRVVRGAGKGTLAELAQRLEQ